MARFRTEGLDELMEDMGRMGLTTGELADKMLFAGAKQIKKAWEQAIKKYKHIDTGDMLSKVDHIKTIRQINGIKEIDIYPKGKDRKGVNNATKAFVLHYGKKGMPGTHFVDEANDNAVPLVEKELLRLFDEWLRNHGWGL